MWNVEKCCLQFSKYWQNNPLIHTYVFVCIPTYIQKETLHTSYGLVAARRGVCTRLAESSTEVFIHHRADIALEVSEEDTAGTQVLGTGRQLLVLLFDRRGAKPAAAVLVVLHFGIQSQLLKRTQIYLYDCNKTIYSCFWCIYNCLYWHDVWHQKYISIRTQQVLEEDKGTQLASACLRLHCLKLYNNL